MGSGQNTSPEQNPVRAVARMPAVVGPSVVVSVMGVPPSASAVVVRIAASAALLVSVMGVLAVVAISAAVTPCRDEVVPVAIAQVKED